jgi:hypothetical protein
LPGVDGDGGGALSREVPDVSGVAEGDGMPSEFREIASADSSVVPIAGLTHAAAAFLSALPVPAALLLPLFLVFLVLAGLIMTRTLRAGRA